MAGAVPIQTQEDIVPPRPAAVGTNIAGIVLTPAVIAVVYLLITGPIGVELVFEDPAGDGTRALTLLQSVGATLGIGIVGLGVVLIMESVLGEDRAHAIFTWVGIGILALSLLPLFVLEMSTSVRLSLLAMHLIAAAILIPALTDGTPAEPLKREY